MDALIALKSFDGGVGTIQEGQRFLSHAEATEKLLASGVAVREGTRVVWEQLDWRGCTVVIIASGPSLSAEDCNLVGQWKQQGESRKVIVINSSYKLALFADVLYACDERWWKRYHDEVKAEFTGQFWVQVHNEAALQNAQSLGLRHIRSESGQGLNRKVGVINQGGNGGYQSLGLAYQAGAAKIILLGFDMADHNGKMHWHEDHPKPLHSYPNYEMWIRSFSQLAKDLRKTDVEVVNASRRSALGCFPRVQLEEVLR